MPPGGWELKAVLLPLRYSIVEASPDSLPFIALWPRTWPSSCLDVSMPIMVGFETAAQIRQRRQSEVTPIIFITAYGNDEILDADSTPTVRSTSSLLRFRANELRARASVFANLFIKAEELAVHAWEMHAYDDQLRQLALQGSTGGWREEVRRRKRMRTCSTVRMFLAGSPTLDRGPSAQRSMPRRPRRAFASRRRDA